MNFKEWSETVETLRCDMTRDFIRDTYLHPKGVMMYHTVGMSRHIFTNRWEHCVVDYTIKVYGNKTLLNNLKGSINEEWYTEDGYGLPQFKGENCLERAFDFINNHLDKFPTIESKQYETN